MPDGTDIAKHLGVDMTKKMSAPFNIGTMVVLNSGGPVMLIVDYDVDDPCLVIAAFEYQDSCTNRIEVREMPFSAVMLTRYPSEPKIL